MYIIIIIIISAWLSVRQRPRENYYVTYKYCLHFNSDSMFQSDRQPPPVIHCAAYFNFEDICEDHGKVQLPWCITENSATIIWLQEFGCITFSAATQSHNSFWQVQNPASDHLHASSCSSPVQWSFILNGLNQKM